MKLLPFQQRFTRAALAPGIRTAALSLPRGNGKSTLAGMMLADHLRRLDGLECVLLAGSLEQARPVFRTIRDELGELDWRHADSKTQIGSRHRHGTTTRLRVISSKGKTAMGLVGVPFVVADEPGAWEVVGGELMHSALQTALGKPGSPMRVIYIGTLAPAISGWWHDMVSRGSHGSTHVTVMRGDRKTWDSWATIRRCNPLMSLPRFPESRATLLEERDDARRDDAKLAQFLSLRLNLPTAAESEMLLTLQDWERVIGRPIPEPAGAPIVGVDLGGNRAWSAAVAIWETGRVEAVAVTPGVPDIDEQERRDRVPAGTYRGLVNDGRLLVADGLNQPEPDQLLSAVLDLWGPPACVVADRFKAGALQDAVGGRWPVEFRIMRWSEQTEDVDGIRKLARDWCIGVDEESRRLLAFSIATALVEPDTSGNVRLKKRGTHNTSRDDVAAAFVLAAGAVERWRRAKPVPPSVF